MLGDRVTPGERDSTGAATSAEKKSYRYRVAEEVKQMAKCIKQGCQANALKEDDYCFSHSQKPEIVEKRTAARSKGGSRGKLKKVTDSIDTIDDIKQIISETLSELRSSQTQNTVAKCRAIGYLASIALTALEKADLEERIAKLEESLAESTT